MSTFQSDIALTLPDVVLVDTFGGSELCRLLSFFAMLCVTFLIYSFRLYFELLLKAGYLLANHGHSFSNFWVVSPVINWMSRTHGRPLGSVLSVFPLVTLAYVTKFMVSKLISQQNIHTSESPCLIQCSNKGLKKSSTSNDEYTPWCVLILVRRVVLTKLARSNFGFIYNWPLWFKIRSSHVLAL